MSAQPGDLVAGCGCIGEAVQFGGGTVGIAVFTDQPGRPRRIAFVSAGEVQVLKLRQDWSSSQPETARQQELAEQFNRMRHQRDLHCTQTW